jgi:AcrR family transcriptional regulator
MDERLPRRGHSPWMPFESRRRARDEKREAVLRAAVQLFLEQGYHRATLNDVAERLNITKPALYNYFRGKDAILFECWMMGQERVETCIARIDAGGGSGLVKLRKLLLAYAQEMTTDAGKSLVRFDVRDLSDKHQKTVRAARREIDGVFRRYISEGIADGSIRPCDVKLSAFAIAGSLNWIGHWYQRDGKQSAETIAAEFALRLTEGLAKRPRREKKMLSEPVRSRGSRGGAR